MLNTQIPLVRDLLDIGYAFPPESEQRQRLNDAAEVLSDCVEACEAARPACPDNGPHSFGAKLRAAMADATREWSYV